eukprot:TRINITY_DN746_c3_g1_i1.p1 TRINITY_DN746_c3_g1~~TRINITY_DN746_c3_g1_i1.p1  ORF type:complete len:668 (+),score=107.89 TRINITY_DN746_c3_g1_i1:40-2043(+)
MAGKPVAWLGSNAASTNKQIVIGKPQPFKPQQQQQQQPQQSGFLQSYKGGATPSVSSSSSKPRPFVPPGGTPAKSLSFPISGATPSKEATVASSSSSPMSSIPRPGAAQRSLSQSNSPQPLAPPDFVSNNSNNNSSSNNNNSNVLAMEYKKKADQYRLELESMKARSATMAQELTTLKKSGQRLAEEKSILEKQQQQQRAAQDTPATKHLKAVVARHGSVRPVVKPNGTLTPGDTEYTIAVVSQLRLKAREHLPARIDQVLYEATQGVSLPCIYTEALLPIVKLSVLKERSVPAELQKEVSSMCITLQALLYIEPPVVGGEHLSLATFDPKNLSNFDAAVHIQDVPLKGGLTSIITGGVLRPDQHRWILRNSGLITEPVICQGGRDGNLGLWDRVACLTKAEDDDDATPCLESSIGLGSLASVRDVCACVKGGIIGVLSECIEKTLNLGAVQTASNLVSLVTSLVELPPCLLSAAAVLHLLRNPISILTPCRELQTNLIYLTISTLRAYPHLPKVLSSRGQHVLSEVLFNNDSQASIPYDDLLIVAAEAAAELLQSLQLQLARYEGGPLVTAKQLQQGMVVVSGEQKSFAVRDTPEADSLKSSRMLDKKALRITVDVLLTVQMMLQAPEFKSLRSVFFNKEEGSTSPVRGRKRRGSPRGSPGKKSKG